MRAGLQVLRRLAIILAGLIECARFLSEPRGCQTQQSIARLLCAIASALVLIVAPLLMSAAADEADNFPTTTPIKHLVIIFQENQSFDHYFGTYPNALNPSGEPQFIAAPGTPSVNGLTPA